MPDHSPPDQEFPFNASLTACVEYAGFRVFAQAVQPLEACAIACGWFLDEAGANAAKAAAKAAEKAERDNNDSNSFNSSGKKTKKQKERDAEKSKALAKSLADTGGYRYIEPDAATKNALQLVGSTLNLKRTMRRILFFDLRLVHLEDICFISCHHK